MRRTGNLLLCTLLLGNTAVNAFLTVVTAGVTSGLLGGLVSTALIAVFGEIMPQTLCSRYGLAIGAKTIWIVKIFMGLLYIIAKPISVILDKILGDEIGIISTRSNLKRLFAVTEQDKLLNP